MWLWNGGVPRMIKGLGGCPRTPHSQPRPSDATVGPSDRTVHHTVRAQWPEIGWWPSRKLAFPMAREGGWVGHGSSTHVGTGLPVCPWTLGTLQCHLSVCGALRGRASHPRPLARAPDFDFGLISSAKFATCERGVLGCGCGTGAFHA